MFLLLFKPPSSSSRDFCVSASMIFPVSFSVSHYKVSYYCYFYFFQIHDQKTHNAAAIYMLLVQSFSIMAMSTPKGACERSRKPSKKVATNAFSFEPQACDSKYFGLCST